jgi:hypothetical protein
MEEKMRELSEVEWEKLRQRIADSLLVRVDAGKLDWNFKRPDLKNPE